MTTYANLPKPFGQVTKAGNYAWVLMFRVTENAPWSIYRWCHDNADAREANQQLRKLIRQGRAVESLLKATRSFN